MNIEIRNVERLPESEFEKLKEVVVALSGLGAIGQVNQMQSEYTRLRTGEDNQTFPFQAIGSPPVPPGNGG